MIVSPLLIGKLIIEPLRYFFANYAGPDFKYDNDPKLTKVNIGSVNDFHQIAIQQLPRVLVDRGGMEVRSTGLTDNLAQSSMSGQFGTVEKANMVFVAGSSTIIIEGRNEGTVEMVTDRIMHFIVWSRPFIMDSQGFKSFAMPLSVGPATPDKEDKEKFVVRMSLPWTREEHWQVNQDALKLNVFYQTLTIDTTIT